jgi:ketosteroid isomerase-like protein
VTTSSESAVQGLLDKQAIEEVVLRYCRGVDRADADLIGSAYHPDAVDDHGNARFTGDTVGAGIVELTSSSRVTMHHVTNQFIELLGPDHAASETYFTVWQTMDRDGREHTLHALGRYVDRMERRGGEWRIAHRLVIVEFTRLLPPDGAMPASAPGLGRRDRSDPSYAVLSGENDTAGRTC